MPDPLGVPLSLSEGRVSQLQDLKMQQAVYPQTVPAPAGGGHGHTEPLPLMAGGRAPSRGRRGELASPPGRHPQILGFESCLGHKV